MKTWNNCIIFAIRFRVTATSCGLGDKDIYIYTVTADLGGRRTASVRKRGVGEGSDWMMKMIVLGIYKSTMYKGREWIRAAPTNSMTAVAGPQRRGIANTCSSSCPRAACSKGTATQRGLSSTRPAEAARRPRHRDDVNSMKETTMDRAVEPRSMSTRP